MKLAVILETREPEKAWNAFRFANTALQRRHNVKLFLMGEAVECEGLVAGTFDVAQQWEKFLQGGGEILACGTCLKSRKMEDTTTCPVSTMVDCLEMVEWADKVLTF